MFFIARLPNYSGLYSPEVIPNTLLHLGQAVIVTTLVPLAVGVIGFCAPDKGALCVLVRALHTHYYTRKPSMSVKPCLSVLSTFSSSTCSPHCCRVFLVTTFGKQLSHVKYNAATEMHTKYMHNAMNCVGSTPG